VENLIDFFEEIGAIKEGHFVYTSGRHGRYYFNKDTIYSYPFFASLLARQIANYFGEREIDLVAGPTMGGAILAQWVGYFLSLRKQSLKILAVFAEEEDQKRVFKRGYQDLVPKKKVLIVDDVLTTGGSIKKVIEAIKKLEGEAVSVGVIVNRGKITAQDLQVSELFSLADLEWESFEEKDCPLCKKGLPINTDLGKAKKS